MCRSTDKLRPFCGVCVKLKSLLKQHIRINHSRHPQNVQNYKQTKVKKKYNCPFCYDTFTTRFSRDKHLLSHNAEHTQTLETQSLDIIQSIKQEIGDISDYESAGFTEHNEHLEPSTSYASYANTGPCVNIKADATTALDTSVLEHALSAEKTNLSGDDVNENRTYIESAWRDFGYKLSSKMSVYCHVVGVNDKSQPTFQCNYCDYVTKRGTWSIKRHHECVHLNLFKFVCGTCTKAFKVKISLQTHVCEPKKSSSVSDNDNITSRCVKSTKPVQSCELVSNSDESSTGLEPEKLVDGNDESVYRMEVDGDGETVEKTLQCKWCPYTSVRRHNIKRHCASHHKREVNRQQREPCSDTSDVELEDVLVRNDDSLYHVAVLGERGTFVRTLQCKWCDYTSRRLHNIRRHCVRRHKHEVIREQRFSDQSICIEHEKQSTILTQTHSNEVFTTKRGISPESSDIEVTDILNKKLSVFHTEFFEEGGTFVKSLQCNWCDYTSIRRDNIRRHSVNRHQDQLKHLYCQSEAHDIEGAKSSPTLRNAAEHGLTTANLRSDTVHDSSSALGGEPQREKTSLKVEQEENDDSSETEIFSDISDALSDIEGENISSQLVNVDNIESFKTETDDYPPTAKSMLTSEHVDYMSAKAKNVVCKTCHKRFRDSTELGDHMNVHKGLKPFSCDLCDKRFAGAASLRHHRHKHQTPKNCVCETCNKAFRNAKELSAHVKVHKAIKPFPCDLCEKSFASSATLRNHKRKQHEIARHVAVPTPNHSSVKQPMPKNFICEICSLCFSSSNELNDHLNVHRGVKPYPCDLCERSFAVYSSLLNHRRLHKSSGNIFAPKPTDSAQKYFACDTCKKRFRNARDLNDHMNTHNGLRPYQCELCDKSFARHSSLRVHKRGVHEFHTSASVTEAQDTPSTSASTGPKKSKPKNHICEICSKCFRDTKELSDHLNVHKGLKPHLCDLCGANFASFASLRHHRRKHTGENKMECSVCNKKLASAHALRMHMNTHTGAKPYSCEYCGRGFACMANLICHIRIHTGEKPYKCKLCEYKCVQSTSLKKHMIGSHGNLQAFPCTLCEKKFKFKSSLTAHLLRHKGENRYFCDFCNKGFIFVRSLREHHRTHTNERPYKCDHCTQAFIRSTHLTSHVKRLHPEQYTAKIKPLVSEGRAEPAREEGPNVYGIGAGLSTEYGGLSTEYGGLSTESGGLGTESGRLGTESGGLGTESGGLSTESGGLSTGCGGLVGYWTHAPM